jgi:hypothetical protein
MNAKQGFGLVTAVAFGGLVTSVGVKSQPVSAMRRWEYATVIGYHDGDVDFAMPGKLERATIPKEVRMTIGRAAFAHANWGANKLAAEGWEAISISSDNPSMVILLRRAK